MTDEAINKRIGVFKEIRNVPFRIPLKFTDPDNCCSGKAVRLRNFFESEGLEARYRVVDFKWSKLGLPQDVLNVQHPDECTHAFVEVKLVGKWIKVDTTWDRKIASVLPVAEWDGTSDTILAVPVENYYGDKDSERLMLPNEQEFDKDIEVNGEFYKAINKWLESVREGCETQHARPT